MPQWLLDLFNPSGAISTAIQTVASFIPNPEEKAKAQLAIQQAIVTAALQADADQRAINKVEAASGSLFVAGGRPAIIWLCAFGLAYQWFVISFLTYLAQIFHWTAIVAGKTELIVPPAIPASDINALVYALLGLGAYRTVDKAIPGGMTKAITGIFAKKQ
jgi:Holin of 3TMs, for gene-transfer release